MKAFLLCSLLFVAYFAAASAQDTIYAIGANGRFFNFTTNNLANPYSGANITNINANHVLRSLDFQPATGTLFVLSSTSNNVAPNAGQIYTVNPDNGYLNPIGSTFLLNTTSTSIHIDFNPVANAIRVISSDGLSLRVNANTGALIATDSYVIYNATLTPVTVSGIAYSNNQANATTTTLYAFDATNNLTTIGGAGQSPNLGQAYIVGASGVAITLPMGLDISNAGVAYASDSAGVIYTVNLATGAFTNLGATSVPMIDIAVKLAVPTPSGNTSVVNPLTDKFFAVTSTNILLSFNSSSFGNPYAGPTISGITAGHTFRSIDYQPASGQLWGLSTVVGASATSTAQLYVVDTVLGYFAPKGSTFTIATNSTSVHIDFNPVANAIRLISADGYNARINPTTFALTVDGPVAYASGDVNANAAVNVAQIAYSNNFNGSTTTTLYGYDSSLNILTTITPPNNGTQNTVGASGITAGVNGPVGLDISSNGQVWASANSIIYPVSGNTGAFGIGSPIGFSILDFAVVVTAGNATNNTGITTNSLTTGNVTTLTTSTNFTTGIGATTGNGTTLTTGVVGTTGTNFTTAFAGTSGRVTTGTTTQGSTTEQSSPSSMIVASVLAIVAATFLSL